MKQPIIGGYLSQIFVRHYKLDPVKAAEEASRFEEILQLYGLQIIIGDWNEPEVVYIQAKGPATGWDRLREQLKDIEESGREPWLSLEIQ